VLGFYSSELPGPKGNRETFVWLADPVSAQDRVGERAAVLPSADEGGALTDRLDSLAREVEP